MDAELADSIAAYLDEHAGVRRLEPEVTETILEATVGAFGLDQRRTWWWESLSDAVVVGYEPSEGVDPLLRLLAHVRGAVVLFVTDDNPPPWIALRGTVSELVGLLREQQFFEYFVVDAEMKWIVFDTHHNRLVARGLAAGDLTAES